MGANRFLTTLREAENWARDSARGRIQLAMAQGRDLAHGRIRLATVEERTGEPRAAAPTECCVLMGER
jgi:hypothetical protein